MRLPRSRLIVELVCRFRGETEESNPLSLVQGC